MATFSDITVIEVAQRHKRSQQAFTQDPPKLSGKVLDDCPRAFAEAQFRRHFLLFWVLLAVIEAFITNAVPTDPVRGGDQGSVACLGVILSLGLF